MRRCKHKPQHSSGDPWITFDCLDCIQEEQRALDAKDHWNGLSPEERIEEQRLRDLKIDNSKKAEQRRYRLYRKLEHFVRLPLKNHFHGRLLAVQVSIRIIELNEKRKLKHGFRTNNIPNSNRDSGGDKHIHTALSK